MDSLSILLHLLGLGLLMICSSFFSGSETALSALTKAQIQRIRQDKRRNGVAVVKFLDDPRRLFITVLFGNILVNMAFVSITGSLIYHRLFQGKHVGAASLLAILIETFVLLVCGEITPKTYAIKHAEKFSMVVARPLWLFSKLIFPFRKILRYLTDRVLHLFGVSGGGDRHPITRDELRAIVKATEAKGALDEHEGEIIHNIFDLRDIEANEAMVPRTEMVCVEVSTTIQDAFDKAREAGCSRLPVYRGEIDNICGIFYVKDMLCWKGVLLEELGNVGIEQLSLEDFLLRRVVLSALNPGKENTLVRPPFFAYEARKIGVLMREMTREKQRVAILLDEYGGVSGLISVEDIVEEVLGEITDAYDVVDGRAIIYDPDDPSILQIPGLVSLRSVNKRLKLKLDESLADTLGGYVLTRFGAIPNEGDVVADEQNNLAFEVLRMDGLRIDQVRIRLSGMPRKVPEEPDNRGGPSPPPQGATGEQGSKGKPPNPSAPLSLCWCALCGFPLPTLPLALTASLVFLCISIAAASGGAEAGQGSSLSVSAFSVVLVLSLILVAFFAGSETAVVSASKARIDVLAEEGNKRAVIIKRLLDTPDQMLGVVLVGTNLMSTTAGQAGVVLATFAFPGQEKLQSALNTVVMTLIILIFCEILPKTIFRARADALALRSAPALRIAQILLYPVVVLVTKITNSLVNIAGEEDAQERSRSMREELKLLATMGGEEGAIEQEQLRMIHSVLGLDTRTIEHVMVPLIHIVAVPKHTRTEVFYRTVAHTGFSRIPVYEDRIDNLIGWVNTLDVLYADAEVSDISHFIRRDVGYEPESKPVYALLREFQHSRNSMAFVVDEYGGIVGLVTLEDLVEEILGEIRDEKDEDEAPRIHRIGDRTIECDGQTEILELNHRYRTDIPTGDYETIAGYVLSLMDRIPKQGESVETDRLNIVILDADARRVRRVRIHVK